eukprot:365065-Chlamydomonas_euryale.AAC.2
MALTQALEVADLVSYCNRTPRPDQESCGVAVRSCGGHPLVLQYLVLPVAADQESQGGGGHASLHISRLGPAGSRTPDLGPTGSRTPGLGTAGSRTPGLGPAESRTPGLGPTGSRTPGLGTAGSRTPGLGHASSRTSGLRPCWWSSLGTDLCKPKDTQGLKPGPCGSWAHILAAAASLKSCMECGHSAPPPPQATASRHG